MSLERIMCACAFFSTKDLSKASSTSRWNTVVGKTHKVCVEAGLRNP